MLYTSDLNIGRGGDIQRGGICSPCSPAAGPGVFLPRPCRTGESFRLFWAWWMQRAPFSRGRGVPLEITCQLVSVSYEYEYQCQYQISAVCMDPCDAGHLTQHSRCFLLLLTYPPELCRRTPRGCRLTAGDCSTCWYHYSCRSSNH